MARSIARRPKNRRPKPDSTYRKRPGQNVRGVFCGVLTCSIYQPFCICQLYSNWRSRRSSFYQFWIQPRWRTLRPQRLRSERPKVRLWRRIVSFSILLFHKFCFVSRRGKGWSAARSRRIESLAWRWQIIGVRVNQRDPSLLHLKHGRHNRLKTHVI